MCLFSNTLLTILLPILLTYILLYHLQSVKSHPSEPPILAPRIPYIGHLLGMALRGGKYTKQLGLSNPNLPIFTLPVPKSRIYIVTDPTLAAAVQRASKALSFTPLVPDLTKRILGLDSDTVKIVRQHLDPEPGQPKGFLADIHDMVYSYLGPGNELNELSLEATRQLTREVDDFVTGTLGTGKEGIEVNLLHWIRHFVTVATAKFLYGPENPLTWSGTPSLERTELEQAFWDFDGGIGQLLIGIVPSLTARKPYRGREKLANALANYLEEGKWKSASKIVQNRVEIALRHGWTLQQTSRSEVSFLFAGIVNTATTTFWVILQLFASSSSSSSQEGLLSTVRKELEAVVEEQLDETRKTGERKRVLSLDKVKNGTACPTLMAVFRECLRVGSDNYSTRLVKTDTMLAGRYFLKKDSVVQIAGGVMHADERIWGGDAGVFNPGRFLSSSSGNVHPAAFRAFGGGKTLCPGRHFATNEILAFVAMIVLTFDLEPVTMGKGTGQGKGKIKVPEKDDNVLPVHILEPKEDVFVRVLLRNCEEETYKRIEVVP
ncbi:putative cytochrome p450 protein [Naviculisporaceae sp. PSN 640]